MSSPTPDKNSRQGRLEGQLVGIAEHVSRMQEELEHLKAKVVELTRVLGIQLHEGRFSVYL